MAHVLYRLTNSFYLAYQVFTAYILVNETLIPLSYSPSEPKKSQVSEEKDF